MSSIGGKAVGMRDRSGKRSCINIAAHAFVHRINSEWFTISFAMLPTIFKSCLLD